MSKPETQPVGISAGDNNNGRRELRGNPAPLSGSKKVKNRNHSRNNHGDGN
jgi:small acid-soluble spore protein P (minor)